MVVRIKSEVPYYYIITRLVISLSSRHKKTEIKLKYKKQERDSKKAVPFLLVMFHYCSRLTSVRSPIEWHFMGVFMTGKFSLLLQPANKE